MQEKNAVRQKKFCKQEASGEAAEADSNRAGGI
jgi:hypothetical protein